MPSGLTSVTMRLAGSTAVTFAVLVVAPTSMATTDATRQVYELCGLAVYFRCRRWWSQDFLCQRATASFGEVVQDINHRFAGDPDQAAKRMVEFQN